MRHEILISDRIIFINLNKEIIQNGIGRDTLDIKYDKEWDQLLPFEVIFSNGEDSIITTTSTGKDILIPWELLQTTGKLYISVLGYPSPKERVITKKMDEPFIIKESGETTTNAPDPTPSEVDLLKSMIESEFGMIRELSGRIDRLDAKYAEAGVDHLIESNLGNHTSSHRKWSSGISEFWGETSNVWTNGTQSGDLYYKNFTKDFPVGLFEEPPRVFVTVRTDENVLMMATLTENTAERASFDIVSTQNVDRHIWIQVYAIGRYKSLEV